MSSSWITVHDFLLDGGVLMVPLLLSAALLWYGLAFRWYRTKQLQKDFLLILTPFTALDLRDDCAQFRATVESIIAIAPLLGLLGTVIGMIETFEALGDMSLFSQSSSIAGGISQALHTTEMGLIVAIPGFVINRWLCRREDLLRKRIDGVLATELGKEFTA